MDELIANEVRKIQSSTPVVPLADIAFCLSHALGHKLGVRYGIPYGITSVLRF